MLQTELCWQPPTLNMHLHPEEVHLWIANLNQTRAAIARFEQSLSQDERMRANAFRFAHLRHHFVAAHGILRDILARYTGERPQALEFSYGPFGKPALRDSSIRFSLSHSRDLALYAIVKKRDVGVDIEYALCPPLNLEQFVSQTFSLSEQIAFFELPKTWRVKAFYNCWTRKEAYLKAVGSGLSYPLDRFDVSLHPEEPARLLHVVDAPEEVTRWYCESFQYLDSYIAALMVEGRAGTVKKWHWGS